MGIKASTCRPRRTSTKTQTPKPCPPGRPSLPSLPSPAGSPPRPPAGQSPWPACRSSSLRRGTSAFPTCPLSDDEISRQIDYLVNNGWAPCIEFASQEEADTNQLFFAGPALYENRYWTMWKLPMFGCQSGEEVLAEIQNCQDEYPGYRVRVVGFDNVRQCQMAGFICRK